MYCRNCGKVLNQGEIFCSNCGMKQENITNANQNFQQMNNMYQQPIYRQQQPVKPKKIKTILAIIGGVVVAIVIIVVAIFLIISASSQKLVCKSNRGNITIMYNKSGITGYMATGMGYDLETQKEYAKKIGMDAYIAEFNNWFVTNTSGTCVID